MQHVSRFLFHMSRFTGFQEQVVAWAAGRSDIQAVLLIGSLARETHPADEWSDVDLILIVDDIERYANHSSWLAEFGDVVVPVCERHQSGDVEWLVLFANGLKTDFYFAPGGFDLSYVIEQASYNFVIRRGAKLLYVRSDRTIQLPSFTAASTALPDMKAFLAVINEFMMNAHKMAKFTRRGDLVRAQLVLESQMRPLMLKMIAWHAQAQFGAECDTWYNGRYLSDWADPRVLLALPNTYSGYSAEETWRSLFGSLVLFYWLGEEMAVQQHYEFPTEAADQVMRWVQEMYPARSNT